MAAQVSQRTTEGRVSVPYQDLITWTAAVLARKGFDAASARLGAETLVRTDARGFATHGVARLKSYLAKLQEGELKPQARADLAERNNILSYRANGQLGQVAGPRAVEAALDVARKRAVTLVVLEDSGHLGALGVIAVRAAEAGFVALLLQSTPAIMSLPGAKGPLVGNNPLALAAPRRDGPPVVIDMACSVSARGNILLAARSGTSIPAGWAVDTNGQPTTDPQAALLGSLLPAGGHKGLLLAMLVDIVAGGLTGGQFLGMLNKGGAPQSAIAGNALLAVFNPDLVAGRAAYDAHMKSWADHITEQGGRIPGERAHAAELEARDCGIRLSTAIVEELQAIAAESGVPFPAIRRQ